MTNDQHDPSLLDQFVKELRKLNADEESQISVTMHPLSIFAIITQIQLASRHPENTGWNRDQAVSVAKQFQEAFNPDTAIGKVLELGWHSDFDIKVETSDRPNHSITRVSPDGIEHLEFEDVAISDLPPELQEKVKHVREQVFGRITEELEGMGFETVRLDEEEDETDS